jgi:hypothetical protein
VRWREIVVSAHRTERQSLVLFAAMFGLGLRRSTSGDFMHEGVTVHDITTRFCSLPRGGHFSP